MKLKIGGKIMAGFCFVLAILALTIVISDWKMGLIGDAVTEVATSYVPLSDKITSAAADAITQESDLKGFLLDRSQKDFDAYEENGKALKKELDEAEQVITESKHMSSLGLFDAVKKLEADYTTFDDSAQRLLEMAKSTQDNSSFKDYFEQVLKSADNFDTEVENVLAKVSHGLDSVTVEAEHHEASAFQLIITLGIVALVVGSLIGWIIARRISKPITRVVELSNQMNAEFHDFVGVVDAVASNDLTRQVRQSEIQRIGSYSSDEVGALVKAVEDTISAKDQIATSLNRMTTNLKLMIRELSENAEQLVSAATEISSSAEQMSKGAGQQAGQIGQISSAVEEMTVTIVESSRNASDASDNAKSASENATKGGQIVGDTIKGMQRIAEVVRISSESIGKLAKSADQIGEIISVIDDIADQTNLLALNAAIEAARAGEQGRGFAVVADEVRKLAERTGKATGEITDMIKGIQGETSDAVHSMESGITEVDSGRQLADKAGSSLSEIVTMSERVMDMVRQIATATEEQSAAAEQISRNIEHISSVTKETATGAEQSASAAEELNRQAEGMKSMVARFKIGA